MPAGVFPTPIFQGNRPRYTCKAKEMIHRHRTQKLTKVVIILNVVWIDNPCQGRQQCRFCFLRTTPVSTGYKSQGSEGNANLVPFQSRVNGLRTVLCKRAQQQVASSVGLRRGGQLCLSLFS